MSARVQFWTSVDTATPSFGAGWSSIHRRLPIPGTSHCPPLPERRPRISRMAVRASAHMLQRRIPKRNPGEGDDAGVHKRAISDGGSYPAA